MRRASQGLFGSLFLSLFRFWTVVVVVAAISTASARAQAQGEPPEAGFADKGHFALSAERLFGYVHVSQDQSNGGISTSTTINSISVLGGPVNGIASIYTYPRVGVDGFIAPSISLGGSLTYFHLSTTPSGSSNSETVSGFLVAPRIGFAARLAPAVWLWPRAGITYVYVSSNLGGGGSSATTNLFAATVEVPVVLALAPQAIAMIGPTLDLGLSGSSKVSNDQVPIAGTSTDIKETDIGLQISFAFYF